MRVELAPSTWLRDLWAPRSRPRVPSLPRGPSRYSGRRPDRERYTWEEVQNDGRNKVFTLPLMRASKETARSVLRALAIEVVYVFPTNASITNFSQMAIGLFGVNPMEIPTTHIIVMACGSDVVRYGYDLDIWTQTAAAAHGYWMGAKRHMRDKVRRLLAAGVTKDISIDLALIHAWRDYASLRTVTQPLRDNGLRVRGRLNSAAWRDVPDSEKHQACAVAAIEGTPGHCFKGTAKKELRNMEKYGCRGLLGE
ncbi:hypothetical protein GGR56DRAFT_432706 [Xylariaceae sp. FL0804]|nr:hypothetical protein GGR56DRAFT_432706 [Xylariaceae sp. FL0804]